MLSNAYFLAKFRFDTAENEPAKNLLIFPILLTEIPIAAAPGGARRRDEALGRPELLPGNAGQGASLCLF